jgi:transcriptional regulator of nitric oxide reductase
VLPEAEYFGDKQGEPLAWPGYRKNSEGREPDLVGYAFLSADVPPEELGFKAPIDMLIGVNTDHNMTGVKILDYEETYRRTKGDFLACEDILSQFRGKPISDDFQITRDIDGIAGSTVSVFAVARGARNAARRVADWLLDCFAITNQPDTPPFFKYLNTRFGYNSKPMLVRFEFKVMGTSAQDPTRLFA